MKKTILITLLIFIYSALLYSQEDIFIEQTDEGSIQLVKMAGPLKHPWSLAILPGSEEYLITERTGNLYLFQDNRLIPITGLPEISPTGQGGLLDIIIDRNFEENRTVYFSFTQARWAKYSTSVAKAVFNNYQLSNVDVIFQADPKTRGGRHFGSRLFQSEEGHLYITLGDRGEMNSAQDLNNHAGSVIRINPDGSIPQDNPFVSSGNVKSEIYSYGHRNPQGLAYNPFTDELWLHEHGPRGGDEVNIVKSGANYGWPLVTFGIDYNGSEISSKTEGPGLEQPEFYWTPSIAPSGMAFFIDEASPWLGDLFVGALAGRHLRRVELDNGKEVDQEILLSNKLGRIRDVRMGDDGNLYILTDQDQGFLYKLIPPNN